MMWCRVCYIDDPEYDFPKVGKDAGGDWEEGLEGIYEKGRIGDHMLTHLKCNLCHFQNMKGRYTNSLIHEYNRLMITIWRASFSAYWIQEPGTLRGNLTILKKMGMMTKEKLGLEDSLLPLGTYPLMGEVLMVMECVTLRLYLRKGRYIGHIQWDRMRKSTTAWANIY